MVFKHAYLNTLLLLQSAFMCSVVKMPLKGVVGRHALIMENHGKTMEIVFLNLCGNPVEVSISTYLTMIIAFRFCVSIAHFWVDINTFYC